MPLYEYRCGACGERFEVLQRLGEKGDGLACPRCQERRAERVLSTFAATTGGGGRDSAMSAGGGACCRGPGFS